MQMLEKVKALRSSANEIISLFKQKIPKWKSDPAYYDKTRWGFVEGDNHGWYKGDTVTLHFGAWCGTYGDSSTYKQFTINGDLFRKHFMNYLNDNKETIMITVANSMYQEAQELVDKAEGELKAELNKLRDLSAS